MSEQSQNQNRSFESIISHDDSNHQVKEINFESELQPGNQDLNQNNSINKTNPNKSILQIIANLKIDHLTRIQKILFPVVFCIACIEALIRQIVSQETTYVGGVMQQIAVGLMFALFQALLTFKYQNSNLVFVVQSCIILTQQPLTRTSLILSHGRAVISTLLFLSFTAIYIPQSEISLLTIPFLVMNNCLRSNFLMKQTVMMDDDNSAGQLIEIPWYDTVIFGCITLLLVFLFSLQVQKTQVLLKQVESNLKIAECQSKSLNMKLQKPQIAKKIKQSGKQDIQNLATQLVECIPEKALIIDEQFQSNTLKQEGQGGSRSPETKDKFFYANTSFRNTFPITQSILDILIFKRQDTQRQQSLKQLISDLQIEQLSITVIEIENLRFELSYKQIHFNEIRYLLLIFASMKEEQKIVEEVPKQMPCLNYKHPSEEILRSIQKISKFAQILEQYLSLESGHQTRTSAKKIKRSKRKSKFFTTQAGLSRIQFFLGFVWSKSSQFEMQLKSKSNAIKALNNDIQLKFTCIESKKLKTEIEQFLQIFNPQIESLNLKVNIANQIQQDIYTDWTLYTQVFYYFLGQAFKCNHYNGVISINLELRESGDVTNLITVVTASGVYSYLTEELQIVEALVETLGGQVSQITNADDCTQVIFEIQVSSYEIPTFRPEFILIDNIKKLAIPSQYDVQQPAQQLSERLKKDTAPSLQEDAEQKMFDIAFSQYQSSSESSSQDDRSSSVPQRVSFYNLSAEEIQGISHERFIKSAISKNKMINQKNGSQSIVTEEEVKHEPENEDIRDNYNSEEHKLNTINNLTVGQSQEDEINSRSMPQKNRQESLTDKINMMLPQWSSDRRMMLGIVKEQILPDISQEKSNLTSRSLSEISNVWEGPIQPQRLFSEDNIISIAQKSKVQSKTNFSFAPVQSPTSKLQKNSEHEILDSVRVDPNNVEVQNKIQIQVNSDHEFSDLSINSEFQIGLRLSRKDGGHKLGDLQHRFNEMPLQDHMRARLDLTLKNKGAYVNKALIALDKNANENRQAFCQQLCESESFRRIRRLKRNHLVKQVAISANSQKSDCKLKSLFSSLASMSDEVLKSRREQQVQSFMDRIKLDIPRRQCKCKDILVVDLDPAICSQLNDIVFSYDQYGADSADTNESALRLLILKLQAQCCRDIYQIIFVNLISSQEVIHNMLEKIDLWNEKLSKKGRPNIKPPIFIGMTPEDDSQYSKVSSINYIILKPLIQQEIIGILNEINGQ